jgi:glycosyltransferase involved in cell wall biosynthesis
MRCGKTVAVVVPAYDEEARVGRVVRNIPVWVDRIIVVDDGSHDDTAGVAASSGDARVRVLRLPENRGVGAAIVAGYHDARDLGVDIVAVMAGDDQMDPNDLSELVAPLVSGEADYVKGNRFAHPERRRMPALRRGAGKVLAAATRATTGLAIDDSQCGYTAITTDAVRRLPLHDLWPRYGYPNDLLLLLARERLRVVERPVRPVYAGERSGVRPWHALVILGILARRTWSARAGAAALTR